MAPPGRSTRQTRRSGTKNDPLSNPLENLKLTDAENIVNMATPPVKKRKGRPQKAVPKKSKPSTKYAGVTKSSLKILARPKTCNKNLQLELTRMGKSPTPPPAPPATARTSFLLVSDTHGLVPLKSFCPDAVFRTLFPRTNVFIHAGDLTDSGSLDEFKTLISWVEKVPAEIKILIAGNHDLSLDQASYTQSGDYHAELKESQACRAYLTSPEMKRKGIWYLEDEIKEFHLTNGAKFKVLASPYTPRRPGVHGTGSFRYDKLPENSTYWTDKFPGLKTGSDVHVTVTHGPPYSILDVTGDVKNVGCLGLFSLMKQIKPMLSVFGHIHECGASARLIEWDPTGNKIQLDKNLRPSIKKVEDIDGALYYNLQETRSVKKGEQTVFVNAAIASNNGILAARSPIVVELELPYEEPKEYEGVGECNRSLAVHSDVR